MSSTSKVLQIQETGKARSDLIARHKLETEFFPDYVSHTNCVREGRSRNKKVREDWSNCGELGRGGFSVVHRQIENTTGRYRAVKKIHKRLPLKIDYSREPFVMAILAKHPSLFVEFLGWFEEPETLYITMEYLEKGDLTKYIGRPLHQEAVQTVSKQILEGLKVMHQQGIAHRDLKPANIFVVSMSPVWVKLGDFGVSKQILDPAITTFHTQVSTPLYGAPEVLGLDSNSETSEYTNSVDIWSLGCVIYELLVGEKLFVSEFQVSCYFLGKWPFPEDRLRGLSLPTDDVGISLLKSMLVIQPEDRPTAAEALDHPWLGGPMADDEDSRGHRDRMPQVQYERAQGRNSENRLIPYARLKKRRSERSPITQDDTRRILGGVGLGANAGLRGGSDPTTLKHSVDTPTTTPPNPTSVESSPVQTEHQTPERMTHNFRPSHSRGPKASRQKQIRNVPQTYPQSTIAPRMPNPT